MSTDQPDDRLTKAPPDVAERLNKGRELVEALLGPHDADKKSGDHDWFECRRCLALKELDGDHGHALLKYYIETQSAALRHGRLIELQTIEDRERVADAMRAASLALPWDDLLDRLRKHRAYATLRRRSMLEARLLALLGALGILIHYWRAQAEITGGHPLHPLTLRSCADDLAALIGGDTTGADDAPKEDA